MAVDVHTHLLPLRLAERIRTFFSQRMDAGDLAYTLDYGHLLDKHLASGIHTVWNLPYAHKAGMARALNDTMLEVHEQLSEHGVEIVSGCTVHPDDPDPVDDLRTAVGNGARVLKLHCSVGDYQPTHPALAPVFTAAGELNIPVTIHAGHSISGHTEPSELQPIAEVVSHHHGTTFVLAHSGHHSYGQAIELMRRLPNMMCDLTPVIHESVPITARDAEEFKDRFMFGTDAPNTGLTAAHLLAHLDSVGMSVDARQRITETNAAALIARSAASEQ
jgi:predicted TIM-barrel fold metal-dependent hydrolase